MAQNGVPRRRKGTEYPKFVNYRATCIRSFFEQPTNASGECTSVLTHASIQPTDAAQLDSISTLQAVLSEPPNVLLDQMISDVEIDEDDVQVISSVDDQSACSIPFLANHTTPNSSKQIESTTIDSVRHNSAEAGSIEDNVTYIGISEAVLMGKAFLEQCRNPALRIDNVLDMQSQELMKSNRLALKSIVECIIFCGKQGISFHGHRDDYKIQVAPCRNVQITSKSICT